ncbi:serine hydrolase domain-containing protein [Amphibacillus sp. Q70]|uniref:serine hydrolase domain-containing protein n=1 Tax=Amphibacillus sp. Q70 TaxID=3453416 RepID=UPI003F839EC1
MNKKSKTLLVIIVLIILLSISGYFLLLPKSNHDRDETSDMFSEIDNYLITEMKAQKIPGLSVGIVKDDQIVYLKGYGHSDPSGQPVTPDTPFGIGSISKPFTSIAILQLVEDNKIDLDTAVKKYLPTFQVIGHDESEDASSAMTVRHLLTQTSGFSQSSAYKTMFMTNNDADALKKSASVFTEGEEKLNRPVGESYEYSNVNTIILGRIIEKVSSQSYNEYMEENIFSQLAMDNSFVLRGEALEQGLATPHNRWFGWNLPYHGPYVYNRGEAPAGFIMSSAKDMSQFLLSQLNSRALEDEPLLTKESIDLMQNITDAPPIGWFVDDIHGIQVIGHAGGSVGYQAHTWFSPDEQLGVIVLTNALGVIDSSFPNTEITTATHIASGIFSLMTNQPIPDQGLTISQKYGLMNTILLLLSVCLVLSIWRMFKRRLHIWQQKDFSRTKLTWKIVFISSLHFIWPAGILWMTWTTQIPLWHVFTIYQPDLILWLKIMAILVVIKGLIEIGFLLSVFIIRKNRFR